MKRFSAHAIIIILLTTGLGAAAFAQWDAADRIGYLYGRAVHPETNLLYGRIDLQDEDRWRKADWPTPEQMKARDLQLEVMYEDIIDTGQVDVRNSADSTSRLLAAILDAGAAGEMKKPRRNAHRVFEGLELLSEVGPRQGFIARSVLPDNHLFLHATPIDMYTVYIYALWKYYHSDQCPEPDREKIRQIMNDICEGTKVYGYYSLPGATGIPAPNGDIAALRPNRAGRILQMYLVGWDITGNQQWYDIYQEKLRQHNHVRLDLLGDEYRTKYPYVPYDVMHERIDYDGLLYNQYALACLAGIEKNPRILRVYRRAMNLQSDTAWQRPEKTPDELTVILLDRLYGGTDIPPGEVTETRLVRALREIVGDAPRDSVAAAEAAALAARLDLMKK